MRRPWLDRRATRDADPDEVPGIGELTAALRARIDALEGAAEGAATGIESDYADWADRAGSRAASAGAEGLIEALGERMRKIGADASEVSALLERYSQIAERAAASEMAARAEAEKAEAQRAETERPEAEPADGDREGAAPPTAEPAAVSATAKQAPPRRTRPEEAAPGEPVEVSEGIRLLATQMSMSGTGRGEIERRLRDDFGVKDASAVVAQLFGG